MVKFLIIILLFKFVLSFKEDTDSFIYWNKEKRLTWQDYKSNPPKTDTAVVESWVGFGMWPYYSNDSFKIRVRSYFDPYKSWTTVYDSLSLSHEQTHFDIAELYARKFRKILKGQKVLKRSFADSVFKFMYYKEYDEFQNKYDREIYHNIENQIRWTKMIDLELDKLNDYVE
jgi:hypothetical protein